MEPIPDWKLPPGTDRGLWDYLQNEQLARRYDDSLAGTPLLEVDLRFAEEIFTEPGSLIDLGCGTGRLLTHFAEKKFSCTGVDLSESMLQVVREKAAAQKLDLESIHANLVELDAIASEKFDYAACLFSTLGMIRGHEPRMRFLRHVHRILKPGGKFVVHVHNRGFQLWTPGGVRWTLSQLGKRLRGRESGDRTMPQIYGGTSLSLHHFSKREILQDLRQAGFKIARCEPVSTKKDGKLPARWFLSGRRAYGFLLAAIRD